MFMKIHKTEQDIILAACDEELAGKTFRDGVAKIDVSEIFYKGQQVDGAGLSERMKDVSIMNLVGDEVIAVAIQEGYVTEGDVILIGGVKHVQVVLM